MIPKKVTLENFLSFGEKQVIAFDDDEPLWVVGGPNGVGKSAVFDAITFCLFGAHRGGQQHPDKLVRHGENGFTVQFEFEFNGIDYRITRNTKIDGRPTARVEQRTGEAWKAITGVNSVAEAKKWSELLLGMGYDAFQTSVLLGQGKADEMLAAGGTKRLEILKKIIAAERYKKLSDDVHKDAAKKEAELDRLLAQRETTPEVTDAQLAEAALACDGAKEAKGRAEAEKDAAAERVTLAKQWAEHEDARRKLEAKLADATARAKDADRIRADHDRLTELARVLPTLEKFVPLRDARPAAEVSSRKLREDHRAAAESLEELKNQIDGLKLVIEEHRAAASDHARAAKSLHDGIEAKGKLLTAAEEIAALDRQVAAFDPTLDSQAGELRSKLAAATGAEQRARDAKTEAETLLKQAEKEQKQFATVAVGVECARCGQVVSEDHAAKERADIADRVRRHAADFARAEKDWKTAGDAITKATTAQAVLTTTIQNRDAAKQQLALQRKNLAAFGGTADAAALGAELTAADADATRLEKLAAEERAKQTKQADALKLADPKVAPLEKKVRDLAAAVQKAETNQAADAATLATLAGQLSDEWVATTAAQLQDFISERQQLATGGVAERFRQWQEDAARRDEWDAQLRDGAAKAAAIPEAARVPVAEAERRQQAAAEVAKQADTAFGIARDALRDLTQQADDFVKLKMQIAAAEATTRVHKRLDELLGKKGLQRELVRTAEAEIVRLANDTVRNLSDGDLSIELDHADDGPDEAFALRVRRDGSPPIDVSYLSGSQKFRVAVAVALAVGRFAAGQARPLECVIIDEGFGSLDKDGLRATADELNKLKRDLKRIILVSHQEDFTESFPVRYVLRKGEQGTTAEKVRR
jgi:DNA repair exonuclease SbcCD ATPase subunit